MKWVLPAGNRVRLLNLGCALFIFLFCVWYATSHQIRRWAVNPNDWSDYGLNYFKSLGLINFLVYPPWSNGFFYPPPNALLRMGLGQMGLETSGILWLVLLVMSAIGVIGMSLHLSGLSKHPAKYVLALLALLAVEYWVEYDLRTLNGNLIYLASLLLVLVLACQSMPYTAGFFLAASIVLKLYSLLFLPYFLLRGQYRLCLAAALWLGIFFVAIPVAYFGMNTAFALTVNWVETLWTMGSSMNFPLEFPAYVISLHKTLLTLLTDKGGREIYNVMNMSEERVFSLTQVVQLVWLGLVAFYFWTGHYRPSEIQPGTRLMMDAGVLTLLPLPLSPLLQPHHGASLLISAIILVSVVFSPRLPDSVRWLTVGILLVCGLTTQFGPSGNLRGLGIMISLFLFLFGLIRICSGKYALASIQHHRPQE